MKHNRGRQIGAKEEATLEKEIDPNKMSKLESVVKFISKVIILTRNIIAIVELFR
jgi:hypothetical protein